MTANKKRFPWQYVLTLLAFSVVIFLVWVSIVQRPMREAIAALGSDAHVSVETEPWLVFRPAGQEPAVGLILYPGARTDHSSYAPVARAIAAEGYLVAVVEMPLNLAIFGAERAKGVIDAFPNIQHWAVGGHSLGGTMAAQFAHRHPDLVQGLVLWASYPANADNLSTSALQVLSISGTQDALTTAENIEASRARLPADTRFVAIEGANHAQFGWYGEQYGDHEATISRDAQQAQVVAATVELLQGLQ